MPLPPPLPPVSSSHISHPRSPSPAARHLGRAGLLPFVACAAVAVLGPAGWRGAAAMALAAYAAVIVSFLGGIHWGLAMRQMPEPSPLLLGWGVAPSLLAWPALLLPIGPALGLLGAGLLLCYAADRRLYPAHGVAAWLGLRVQLTAVASLCCWVAAAAPLWWR